MRKATHASKTCEKKDSNTALESPIRGAGHAGGASRGSTDAPQSMAEDEEAWLAALDEQVRSMLDDRGRSVYAGEFMNLYEKWHGEWLDVSAYGCSGLGKLLEKLPSVELQFDASKNQLRISMRQRDAEEVPPAASTVSALANSTAGPIADSRAAFTLGRRDSRSLCPSPGI